MMQPWSLCCHSLENSCSSSPGVFQISKLNILDLCTLKPFTTEKRPVQL
jgi:hypothetical protein